MALRNNPQTSFLCSYSCNLHASHTPYFPVYYLVDTNFTSLNHNGNLLV